MTIINSNVYAYVYVVENINSKFKITNDDKGHSATLTLLSPVDREEKKEYRFYVVAEDHGVPPKSHACEVSSVPTFIKH